MFVGSWMYVLSSCSLAGELALYVRRLMDARGL